MSYENLDGRSTFKVNFSLISGEQKSISHPIPLKSTTGGVERSLPSQDRKRRGLSLPLALEYTLLEGQTEESAFNKINRLETNYAKSKAKIIVETPSLDSRSNST